MMSPDDAFHASETDVPTAIRRMQRLGKTDAEIQHALIRIMKLSPRRERLIDRIGNDLPSDHIFDDMLSAVAQALCIQMHLPPVHPGLDAFKPFLKQVRIEGESLWTLGRSTRHFYDPSDFAEIRPLLTQNSSPDDAIAATTGLCDYLPLSQDAPADILDAVEAGILLSFMGQDPEDPEFEGQMLDIGFYCQGSRIVSDAEGLHVLQLVNPRNQGTAIATAAVCSALGRREIRPEQVALFHRTSIPHRLDAENARFSNAWLGFDVNDPLDSFIGWASNETMPLYTEDEADAGFHFAHQMLRCVSMNAVKSLALPVYFAHQVDAVEDGVLDASGRPAKSSRTPRSARRAKGQKAFRLVRALRRPDWTEFRKHAAQNAFGSGARAEPETQVPVRGFWRRLKPTSIGRDHRGAPVMGKTWVTPHTRWNQKPPAPDLPVVKEPLAPYLRQSRQPDTAPTQGR